jgi:hypothetical protein
VGQGGASSRLANSGAPPLERSRGKGKSMKAGLIAAIVAAVIASATATAATIVVTSKNIKNGTIQMVDISAKAKRALKGRRGPRGLAGAPGPVGPAGAAGAAGARGPSGGGWTDLEWVASNASGTGEVLAQVQCPAGKIVVSGGGESDTGLLDASRLATPQGWAVQGFSGTDPQTVSVQALCARFVAPGQ